MELNAKKLKCLCYSELEFIAREGRFNFRATSAGSKLYAILRAMSAVFLGDTQLVESINSIIRLISSRCPRIDLPTLSSRLIVKKSCALARATGEGVDDDSACKRWSAVKRRAGPVLQDLLGSGENYKPVLDTPNRFTPTSVVDWAQLHDDLANTNLSLALPDLKITEVSRMLAGSVLAAHKAQSQFRKDLADSKGRLWSTASQGALQLQAKSTDTQDAAGVRDCHVLCATSLRSHMVVAKLERTDSGELRLQGDRFQFTTMKEILQDMSKESQTMVASSVANDTRVAVEGLHLFRAPTGGLAALQVDALPSVGDVCDESASSSKSSFGAVLCGVSHGASTLVEVGGQSEPGKPASKRKKLLGTASCPESIQEETCVDVDDATIDAEITELADVEAGYGFGEEEDNSTDQANKLMDELDDSDINKRNASAIAGVTGKDKQASAQSNMLRALEHAKELVKANNNDRGGSAVKVALTGAELEEEALLLLVRTRQEVASQSQSMPPPKLQPGRDNILATGKAKAPERPARETKFERSQTDWDSVADCLGREAGVAQDDMESASDEDPIAVGAVAPGTSAAVRSIANTVGVGASGSSREGQAESARRQWSAAMAQTWEAIKDARTRCLEDIGFNDELSLLARKPRGVPAGGGKPEQPGELLFVKWVDVTETVGRLVRIDSDNRVVYCPASMFGRIVPTHVFMHDEHDYLVHAVGASSRKYKRQHGWLRDELPSAVVRFRAFAQVLMTYANQELCACLCILQHIISGYIHWIQYTDFTDTAPILLICVLYSNCAI